MERRAGRDTPPNPLSLAQVACPQRGNACERGLEWKAGREVVRITNGCFRKNKKDGQKNYLLKYSFCFFISSS